ncbi:fibrinogen silencer-binding protein [Ornithorhynchus anatinus]|uniref:RAD54 homolog B n=1 Tax=Ornithorhynchus anatinus TaxID=9258 RepID=A0A6I8NJZ6_ORNAN|nr:fibrinogen silencer-binding protein [Ornithorhynchus anatinus]XP_007668872.1 fibrinogen silencer-binding protein [Ornithorhynchus anatinus]XP_039767741.1 fibrinogen silencer-binding protein [Ornithorhynchus anatinus]XP_039767742.1 fibrinogen silencer-binding protein [Ornithorhynchus anatinus]
MVGKARSSNFTLSEKLDLLKLVKPYVKILEEHTNKHSVIVEKNKCWDLIADNYNAVGVDRPPRTAQGLRTLYKRLKEYAKQELLQQRETQADYKSSVSEPTRKVVEMIPQLSSACLGKNSGPSANLDKDGYAGPSPPQVMLDHPPVAVAVTMELEQEEDIKPPPPMIIDLQQSEVLEQREEHESVQVMERSPSPSLSSVDMRMTLSPSSLPRRDDFLRHESGERFRPALGYDPQTLQMLKEEHQVILENQRKFGLYVQEKRDGLKRRQRLEEELLKAKIKVEKLKAVRLRRDLPDYNIL